MPGYDQTAMIISVRILGTSQRVIQQIQNCRSASSNSLIKNRHGAIIFNHPLLMVFTLRAPPCCFAEPCLTTMRQGTSRIEACSPALGGLRTVLNRRGENENLEARSDYLLILPVMRKTAIFRPLSRKALKNQRPFPTLFVPPRLDGVTGLRKCAQLEDCLAVVFQSDGVT
jgi:hypothetical protein